MSKSTLHDEYVAVRPTHIPYYQQTPLYYQADDGTWELYKDKDEQLGAERMEQERHPQLFIRVADREAASVEAQRAFNRVLEKSLESNDKHQVQASLTGNAQETLDEPRSGTLRQASRSVALLARASLRDPAILHQLLALSTFDYGTALHSVNVMALTLGFAHKVGFGWQRTLSFGVAALLHDIGKVAIPERILKSPNRLTDEEFRLVRQHPMMAVSILDRAGVGMPKVREAATEHHEKIDGSGYPRGIKDISLVGQVVGIIDAYEALTNEARPYRRALPPALALKVLREEADRGRYMCPLYNRFVLSLTT